MNPEIVDAKLRQHLEHHGLLETLQPTSWKVDQSKLIKLNRDTVNSCSFHDYYGGRGLIATRDIEVDELIYMDSPLIVGPRFLTKNKPMCVQCFRTECTLFPCDAGCGLPVCSDECQENPDHRDAECAYLRDLEPICGPGSWLIELLPVVIPIKALLLKNSLQILVASFKGHEAPLHGREVDILKRYVKKTIKIEDEEFMRMVCRVMDTNSCETVMVHDNTSTSLRALFPTCALTNHQCAPNTRHHVNDKGQLFVYAAKSISQGDEITMSYTELLWDTMMRRQYLQATKHFRCQCFRCSDSTESGSFLGALWCAKADCAGILLPDSPLNFSTKWTCDSCGLKIKSTQIMSIRAGIEAAIEEVIYKDIRKILRFTQRELTILVPETSHFMMEMMFRIVSIFGRSDQCPWQNMTDEELNVKIQYCERLLHCLNQLNCGECTKKGLILYELHCTNAEKFKRSSKKENIDSVTKEQVNPSHNKELYAAIRILKSNIVAPLDYRKLYQSKSLIS